MKIKKTIKDNLLEVVVEISLRDSIEIPKTYFYTKDLINILTEEHKFKIKKTLESPSTVLSNSRRGFKEQKGTWLFELLDESPPEKKVKQTRRRNPKKKPTLRNRISSIAQNKD
jgi:hypothetical protein